jgi:hypothetical protein
LNHGLERAAQSHRKDGRLVFLAVVQPFHASYESACYIEQTYDYADISNNLSQPKFKIWLLCDSGLERIGEIDNVCSIGSDKFDGVGNALLGDIEPP